MNMDVVYKTKNADVIYYSDKNVVLVIWNGYCELGVYRNILMNALDVIKEHKCDYVADTRNGFVDNPRDTIWVKEVFMVKAKEYGCKTIYFIVDEEESLKDELKGQERDSSMILNFKYIHSLDEI